MMNRIKQLAVFAAFLLVLPLVGADVLAQPYFLYEDDPDFNATDTNNYFGYSARRAAGNYSGLVTPYVDEDPDGDASLSTYYLCNNSVFSTFVDGAKGQTKVGDFADCSGLVSYWSLDNDNAWDPISGNNGTLNGSVTTGVSGKVKNAYDFDNATSDYVDTNLIPNWQQGTIVMWLKPTNAAGTTREGFLYTRDSGDDDDIEMNSWDDGNTYWGLYIDGTYYRIAIPDSYPSGWFMATLTWDIGANTGEVFWDTTSKGTIAPSGDFTDLDRTAWLGSRNPYADNNYTGSIDDVRLYNRALSSAEISALYDATKPTAGNDPTFGPEQTTNNPPSITINDPQNQTYFDYNHTLDFDVSDDSSSWIGVNISRNGTQFESLNLSNPDSYAKNYSFPLGTHTYNITAWDNASQVSSKERTFTIDNYEFQSQTGTDTVYETSNQTYDLTVYSGDMVKNITGELYWNGSLVSNKTISHSGIGNETITRWKEIPLVKNNDTTEKWYWKYNVTWDKFDGTGTTTNHTTSKTNQTVLWAFWIDKITQSDTTLVEGRPFDTDTTLITKENTATLTVNTTFNESTKDDTQETYNTYSNSFETPKVNPPSKNFPVYSNVTVSFNDKSFLRNSETDTVTVYRINLTDCSGSNPVGLNYTLWEEQAEVPLTGDLATTLNVWKISDKDIERTYSFSETSAQSDQVCVYPPWATYVVNTDSSIYESDGFDPRRHYLTNATVDNVTDKVKIYLLNQTDSMYFNFQVVDTSDNPVENVIVKFQRYYEGTDSYKLVAMGKTNKDGYSNTYLELQDVKYRVILEKDDKILRTYDPQIYTCTDNPCTVFRTEPQEYDTYFEYEQSLAYQCNFNVSDKNQLICDVNDVEGTVKKACLDVDQLGVAGKTDYDEQCGTSSSMVLKSNLTDAINSTVAYTLRVEFDDGTVYTFVSDSLSLGVTAAYGMMGVFMTFLTFLVLSMIGIFDPGASIFLGVVALILSAAVGFLAISTGALASIVIVGAVLIVRMR